MRWASLQAGSGICIRRRSCGPHLGIISSWTSRFFTLAPNADLGYNSSPFGLQRMALGLFCPPPSLDSIHDDDALYEARGGWLQLRPRWPLTDERHPRAVHRCPTFNQVNFIKRWHICSADMFAVLKARGSVAARMPSQQHEPAHCCHRHDASTPAFRSCCILPADSSCAVQSCCTILFACVLPIQQLLSRFCACALPQQGAQRPEEGAHTPQPGGADRRGTGGA